VHKSISPTALITLAAARAFKGPQESFIPRLYDVNNKLKNEINKLIDTILFKSYNYKAWVET
jgi:hypothetical protein